MNEKLAMQRKWDFDAFKSTLISYGWMDNASRETKEAMYDRILTTNPTKSVLVDTAKIIVTYTFKLVPHEIDISFVINVLVNECTYTECVFEKIREYI